MSQSKHSNLTLILLLAFLYYATGELSSFIFSNTSIISVGIFIPEGIALGFALYFGKKVVPGIFLGQFLFAYLNSDMFFGSLMIAIINSMEAYLAIYLFEKFKLDIHLKHFRDFIGLVLMIILVLQPFSAITSNIMLYWMQDLHEGILLAIFSWWFGNIMSQILYTPFLLLLFVQYKYLDKKEYLMYSLIYTFIVYFFLFILPIHNPFLVMIISLPILIYIIFQKGLLYGMTMNVVLSFITSLSFIWKIGAFQTGNSFDNAVNYNLFILVHLFISITVGLLVEQRRRYEEELENIIEIEIQKNKEQQLMMIQQSRLAQMGEMISMIAHQWRQPLNNLSLINQLLISKYKKKKLDDEVLEYFKSNSKKQIDLMSTTIDDFRNFFRTEQEKKEVEIGVILQSLFDITEPIYTNSGVRLISHLEECFMVYIYPNALSQAILNIINNAKDALAEREIDQKEIHIFVNKVDDDLILSIEDNAGGIDPEIIDKIFDPYFSTKQEKNGTGLGLYMTKMIIEEQLESKIFVENTKNGAKFTIYLKGKNCEQ